MPSVVSSDEEIEPPLVPQHETLRAPQPEVASPPFLRPVGAPRLASLRAAFPSVMSEDEDHEDSLAAALLPLHQAERGLMGSDAEEAPSKTEPPLANVTLSEGLGSTSNPAKGVVASLRDVMLLDPELGSTVPETDPSPPPIGLDACLSEIGVAVIETDPDGIVTTMNEVAERLTGWNLGDARGAPSSIVFRERPRAPDEPLGTLTGSSEHTTILERRDGQLIPIRHVTGMGSTQIDALASTLVGPLGRLIVFRDVSGQQLLALKLAHQARYDGLTGLLNRRALTARVEQALRDPKSRVARHVLCYFNLDRFRLVNTACGHDAGDDLLQWVATRLHEFVGPLDAAGRIGSDEFALLLVGRDAREGERVARDLQRRLLEFRFGFNEKTFAVGASFGVVPFGSEFSHADEVLSTADHMCRLAKEAGRGRIHVFVNDDNKMVQSRQSIQWVAALQRNLEEGRLRLFAQTIQPLTLRGPAGAHFEILVRLVDEEGRFQSPVGIIQAAENSGMMDAIDRFVVKQAFRVIGALPQRAMRRLETCAINLSGVSLTREGLLDYIVQEMQRANVPPSKISFEITETAALANLGEVLWFMQELGAMGCRFAIDDFGSGHASYGYIENLPVDYMKIDGMFVRDLPDNALHRAIVESVHRIGCTLGIRTIAEAVETQAIADLLLTMGVHYAQGWLYGRPKPLTEVCAELDRP